jgi:hypothetical protein
LTKFKGPFAGIRELLRFATYIEFFRYSESGIVEMIVDGQAIVDAEIIKGMKKSGYEWWNVHPSTASEYIDNPVDFTSDIEDEDDVPAFVHMKMRFKDTEPPPVENSRKSYLSTLRTKTLLPEFEAAALDSKVDTDHHHEDDDVIDDEDVEDGVGGS